MHLSLEVLLTLIVLIACGPVIMVLDLIIFKYQYLTKCKSYTMIKALKEILRENRDGKHNHDNSTKS